MKDNRAAAVDMLVRLSEKLLYVHVVQVQVFRYCSFIHRPQRLKGAKGENYAIKMTKRTNGLSGVLYLLLPTWPMNKTAR